MRRIAQTLAVAGAVVGMGLTSLPAIASTAGASRPHTARSLTPAQRRALALAKRIRARSARHGTVTGSVLRPDGAPAASVCVRVTGAQVSRTTFTSSDGRFVVAGLPFGAYRVQYRGCSPIGRFTSQWYGGLTKASAARVVVAGQAPVMLAAVRLGMISPRYMKGQASPLTARPHQTQAQRLGAVISKLQAGKLGPAVPANNAAHISGKVTSSSGKGLGGICVIAISTTSKFLFGESRTSANGTYKLRTAPSRYRVDFVPLCGQKGNFAPQLWKDAASAGASTMLRLKPHMQVGHIDATLGAGAQVTGRVRTTKASHPPFTGVCVEANGTGGQRFFFGQGRVHADGTFRVPSLATGKYRLSFFDCGQAAYLPLTLHKLISVTDGSVTSGVGATLLIGGTVTGTVKDANGHLLSGICVGASPNGREFFIARTEANGHFEIQGLPAGAYRMEFATGCGNKGPFAPLSLPGKVTVRPGKVTSGVNAVLAFDGSIAGIVKNMGGQPLSGICAVAVGPGDDFLFARTKADGTYKLAKAPPGAYQMEFIPGGSFSDCGNKGNYLPVTAAATVTSQVTSTVNAVMPTGGVLTGVITDVRGKPLAGVCVFSSGQSFFGNQIVTKSDGSYRMTQLFTGSYDVGFSGGCGNTTSVAPQAYKGDPTFFAPRAVTVTQGAITSGIGARMRPGGTITGHVTDTAGNSVGGTCVFLEAATGAGGGGEFADLAVSRHGHYSVTNLPPGQYDVIFSGRAIGHRGCGPSPFADQQFKGLGVGARPDLVSVPGGAVTSGVNATLAPAGKISGVVRNTAGRTLGNICVTATDAATKATGTTFTVRHGHYVLPDLPAGRYKVEFTNCGATDFGFGFGPNYANQWYKGKSTAASADPVVVKGGATTTGINAALRPGGAIAGQVVFKRGSRPVAFVCVAAFTPDFSVFSEGLTDRRGNYVLNGLSTGNYLVEFAPCSFESALAGQIKTGTVHVVAGHEVRGVRETLQVGGSIAGATRFLGLPAASRAAPGTCVEVLPLRPANLGTEAFTSNGGSYVATNLAPGPYQVVFGDPACSSDEPSLVQRTSSVVYVTSRHTTGGVNTTLSVTGGISGAVRAPGGSAIKGVCAEAVSPRGTVIGVSAGNGYAITGLQPGRYKIEFTTGCGAIGFATRWYKNAATEQGATAIVVKAGTIATGINGTLPPTK